MSLALMWEAAAVAGRGEDLLAWARQQSPTGRPLRRETFTAPGDRVLVITWWPADSGSTPPPPELPDPPADLVRRPVHRWRFTSVGVD
ncbi:hypothetical protein ACSMX9_10000 [Streptomyces sp. LE64]|uniref:hypothetical protein n=1 Tax=Streptomyces sp. LE64 TaxID=3448653 RepID=UPI00404247C2